MPGELAKWPTRFLLPAVENCFWRSSGPKLLQYIFALPALITGPLAVVCVQGPQQPGSLPLFPFLLLLFGVTAGLMALIFGGRFAKITTEGAILSVYKPYALVDRRQSINLTTVEKVSLSGFRVQEKYLDFSGRGKDVRTLLLVRIVPLAEEDLATFAAFLHGQGITTNF